MSEVDQCPIAMCKFLIGAVMPPAKQFNIAEFCDRWGYIDIVAVPIRVYIAVTYPYFLFTLHSYADVFHLKVVLDAV